MKTYLAIICMLSIILTSCSNTNKSKTDNKSEVDSLTMQEESSVSDDTIIDTPLSNENKSKLLGGWGDENYCVWVFEEDSMQWYDYDPLKKYPYHIVGDTLFISDESQNMYVIYFHGDTLCSRYASNEITEIVKFIRY